MDVDTLIIGAGVVGLAVAAELAPTLRDVLVVERHFKFGQETSSHNSEVLHASLYYPPGSLKSRLCLEGNRILREWATLHGIPVLLTGKLVVASAEEEGALEQLYTRARANGVEGLTMLSKAALHALEPALSSTAAMLSPHTGILDSHALMRFYLHVLEDAGGSVAYQTRVTGMARISGGYAVETMGPDGVPFTLTAQRVVNAGGLYADQLAAQVGIDVDAAGYRLHFCRGDYFSTHPRCWNLVKHLIYPVPGAHAAGLGIHVSLDLQGRMRLGPDTTWLAPNEPLLLRVDASKREQFAQAAQRYLPAIRAEDLEPELAGMRPKLQAPGGPVRDFVIQEETARGLPGFVNLIGIESPGLTASPAIAREVRRLLTIP